MFGIGRRLFIQRTILPVTAFFRHQGFLIDPVGPPTGTVIGLFPFRRMAVVIPFRVKNRNNNNLYGFEQLPDAGQSRNNRTVRYTFYRPHRLFIDQGALIVSGRGIIILIFQQVFRYAETDLRGGPLVTVNCSGYNDGRFTAVVVPGCIFGYQNGLNFFPFFAPGPAGGPDGADNRKTG